MMVILQTMGTMIIMPFVAFIVAALFLAIWKLKKLRSPLFTGVTWAVYGIYEYGMYLRILCTGECNIRIDLLVIYPSLLLLSAVPMLIMIIETFRKTS